MLEVSSRVFAVIRLEETKMIVILSAGFFLSTPDKADDICSFPVTVQAWDSNSFLHLCKKVAVFTIK